MKGVLKPLSCEQELDICKKYIEKVPTRTIVKEHEISYKRLKKILDKHQIRRARQQHLPDDYDPNIPPTKKKCYICKQDKPLCEFDPNKIQAFGVASYCRICSRIKSNERQRERYETDPQYREKSLACSRRARQRDWFKEFDRVRRSKPESKIKQSLMQRTRAALFAAGTKKAMRTEEYLGISCQEFSEYIKTTWTEGMSWDNYGQGENLWNIDHIIPCSAFNLLDVEEQKKCFNYKNLRALWSSENCSKNSKLPDGRDARKVFGEMTYKTSYTKLIENEKCFTQDDNVTRQEYGQ